MPKKEKLIEKLLKRPYPKNFKKTELDALMSQCGCTKFQGGRGSGIKYVHNETKRILQFDEPHPGNELYGYHVRETIKFLKAVKELD